MKTLIIFLITLLNSKTFVKSQELRPPSYDAITYGETINRAELQITNWQFHDAFKVYDSLNNSSRLKFAKDYFNASLCLAYIKDDAKLYRYLKHLLGMGVRTSWLKKDSAMSVSLSESLWRELEQSEKKYENAPNSLRDSLQSLVNADQQERQVYNAYTVNKIKIRSADSTNIIALNKIIKEYGGFPTENHLGVHDYRLVWQPYYVIILHQTPANKLYEYYPMILQEIVKGNIEPHTGSILYTACSGDGKKFGSFELTKIVYTGNYSDSVIQTNRKLVDSLTSQVEWRVPIYSDEVIERINKERRAFGMESIADLYKKAVFLSVSQKPFIFFDFKKNIFLTSQKEFAESFLRGYKPLY